ncbi:MAG TPA: hypothetical protein VJK72_01905 [Candidatus Nanoarchaeia archaeon]|nr:hypothetical protein [Candidatus Nanoarchaeia archaeon]
MPLDNPVYLDYENLDFIGIINTPLQSALLVIPEQEEAKSRLESFSFGYADRYAAVRHQPFNKHATYNIFIPSSFEQLVSDNAEQDLPSLLADKGLTPQRIALFEAFYHTPRFVERGGNDPRTGKLNIAQGIQDLPTFLRAYISQICTGAGFQDVDQERVFFEYMKATQVLDPIEVHDMGIVYDWFVMRTRDEKVLAPCAKKLVSYEDERIALVVDAESAHPLAILLSNPDAYPLAKNWDSFFRKKMTPEHFALFEKLERKLR